MATTPRRRAFLRALVAGAGASASHAFGRMSRDTRMLTLITFGDSILDCARYNAFGVHPGQLLVRNEDRLFPDFAGRDLTSWRGPARLEHRAEDGARVDQLADQARDLAVDGPAVALLTIGGNDLLGGLSTDKGSGVTRFEERLDGFLRRLPLRPVLVGTVYDPTFGDDARNFLGVDAALARANFQRVNTVLAELGRRYGSVVDIHDHFLRGDPSWFTHTIEPSLRGASEVRAAFLPAVARALA